VKAGAGMAMMTFGKADEAGERALQEGEAATMAGQWRPPPGHVAAVIAAQKAAAGVQ
jgi:hypothetical protein